MQSLEKNKEYKDEIKRKKLSDKIGVKLEKSKSANSRRKSKLSSLSKRPIGQKTQSKGILIRKKKKKTKSRSQLVKELDQIFSRYIRMRDADKNGICTCITCGSKVHRKNIQNGHFISRGNYKYRRSVVNCWSQCMPCNIYKSGNYIAYTLFMIGKYGQGIVEEMQQDRELIKISTPEIREMIEKYNNEVELLMKAKSL